jgi:hypothetical protein
VGGGWVQRWCGRWGVIKREGEGPVVEMYGVWFLRAV